MSTCHFLLALFLTPSVNDSPVWDQWRGPARDGRVDGPKWPDSLSKSNLTQRWRIALDKSYSGPLVSEDRVFTTATVNEEEEVVVALDRDSGDRIWETRWKGAMKVPFFAARNGSWIRSTPAMDDDRLYVAGIRDLLVCLDQETGEELWRVDFPQRFGTSVPSFGFASSPLLLEDGVIVQAGASLVKLDKETGETLWRSLEDKGGDHESPFSSPILAEIHGKPQLVVLTRQTMNGVDPEHGHVLWARPIKATRGMNILTPMVFGNTVFTAAHGGRAELLEIQEQDGGYEVRRLWDNGNQAYMSTPVAIDDHLYFFPRSNRFSCLRLDDGEVMWTSGPTGDEYWSLVHQEELILALTNNGTLRLIEAAPEEYLVVGEVQVADAETWAHLAVSGTDVFIRELEGLSAWSWGSDEATTSQAH